MFQMNYVVLGGYLTNDTEVRYTKTGKSVVTFHMATNKKIGEDKQKTAFIKVQSWHNAEEIGALKKGDYVVVVGEIETGSYEKDEKKVYTWHVLATSVTKAINGKQENGNYDAFIANPSDEEIPF